MSLTLSSSFYASNEIFNKRRQRQRTQSRQSQYAEVEFTWRFFEYVPESTELVYALLSDSGLLKRQMGLY
jgi:hypothetical protein